MNHLNQLLDILFFLIRFRHNRCEIRIILNDIFTYISNEKFTLNKISSFFVTKKEIGAKNIWGIFTYITLT